MKIYFTVTILLFTTLTQAQNLTQSIEQQINAAREKENSTVLNWSSYGEEEKTAAISSLQTYSQDSLLEVRLKAYDLLYQLMLNSNKMDTRQASFQAFLQGLKDEERAVQGFIADRFQSAEAEVYTDEMRNLLVGKLNPRPFYYEELVLALAHINEQQAIKPIINHLRTQSSEMSQMERWQAHIALARLGEKPALDFIVRKAQELPVNDDMIYDIYPTLAFTRQKAAVDVLVEQVFNEEQNCSSPDPDSNQKITCAYRILEIIAPIIQDFPIPVDEATGDLDTDDYEAALQQAREWLEANQADYSIVGQ
jgi:HEAT repeat protein